MTIFNSTEPIVRIKQQHLDVQDLKGLLKFNVKIGNYTLYSGSYTRIDQVFLLWGLISLIIFITAQFFPMSWIDQAYYWSGLTLFATIGMIMLTYCWVRIEQVTWLVYCWALLMFVGVGLTNLGIFWGWSHILANLCPLWLIVCGLGYLATGIALQSRSFTLAGLLHFLTIPLLCYVSSWQFLATGIILAGTLLFFAEVQWDMRPPIESPFLTVEQLAFNRQQHLKRQME
ncbi:hypothetical protein ACL6C3_27490 [Capilliphycus salinus ALCB114379]|uniref:hypothetical protein n=1 Tax=Capilliphycus salinus TaxID=2768948 RepID=UPI0039A4D81A